MNTIKSAGFLAFTIISLVASSSRSFGQSVAYYSMQCTNWPPLPTNIYPSLQVYPRDHGGYWVDDRSVDYSSDAEPDGSGGGPAPLGSPGAAYGTNLWIQILGITNSQVYVQLNNTIAGNMYQLQYISDLTPGAMYWTPGEIITATNTQIDFDPVDMTSPNLFFRAEVGTQVIGFYTEQDVTRPDLPRDPGSPGDFVLVRSDTIDPVIPATTVYYTMSGSAVQGVDYDELPGYTNFASGNGFGSIVVTGIQDTNVAFNENIIMTLVPTNTYLVSSTPNSFDSITLYDNLSTNSFLELVASNLTDPSCVGYHPLSNCLIISLNGNNDSGFTSNTFVRIDTNANVSNWTGISNLIDEVNFAIVQTNLNGFNEGDMYFGTGTNGVIAWLSSNGTTSNLDWLALPGESNPLRGGFCFDRTGIFTNNLIVATGDISGFTGGDIWAVTSETNASFLTSVGNVHLEGMEILPDNNNAYGPWAGKILTGYARGTELFTIDSNLNVATFQLGIQSEDIHIIPTNQDFYFTDEEHGVIFKLSRTLLTNYVGDILITQQGGFFDGPPAMVFIVHWDTSTSSFLLHTIPAPSSFSDADFEQGTFAPINIPATPIPN